MIHNPLIGNSLDALRLEVRSARYQNTESEVKAVTDRDHEIRQMVETHEDNLVLTAEDIHRSGDPVIVKANDLLTEMSDLCTDIERAGTDTGPEHAARFENIRHRMQARITELARIEREAEFHAALVADPYGSLTNLRRKYPQIIAGRRLS